MCTTMLKVSQGSNEHARTRRADRTSVQLSVARATSPGGPPVAGHSPDDRSRPGETVPEVHEDVFDDRPSVDSAGTVAASIVAASAVHRSQRADADGAIGIQPAVPVVRWPEHG